MVSSGKHRYFSIIKTQVPWPFQVHPYQSISFYQLNLPYQLTLSFR
ncbi:MAG: hypothetical protein ACYS4W_07365 [Planctomycetota bacterium]